MAIFGAPLAGRRVDLSTAGPGRASGGDRAEVGALVTGEWKRAWLLPRMGCPQQRGRPASSDDLAPSRLPTVEMRRGSGAEVRTVPRGMNGGEGTWFRPQGHPRVEGELPSPTRGANRTPPAATLGALRSGLRRLYPLRGPRRFPRPGGQGHPRQGGRVIHGAHEGVGRWPGSWRTRRPPRVGGTRGSIPR